jgi:hypothetical protein
MKNFLTTFLICSPFFAVNGQSEYKYSLHNSSERKIVDYTAEISLSSLQSLPIGEYVATDGKTVVPVEITTDLKGKQAAVFPVESFEPGESKTFTILSGNTPMYPKRTYAEIAHKIGGQFDGQKYTGGYSWVKPNYLRQPDNFRDHAYYIKYEGPGWESDKVGFRFYLDQRNGIDVFAKKTSGIVLPFVGVDGYDSYHLMADWGMDNMKVGNALGIGSIAFWNGEEAVRVEKNDSVICYIPKDGKIRSQVMTTYYGWDAGGTKCDLKSLISIDAGSRASRMELFVDKELDNLSTGIIKMKDTEFFTNNNKENEWSYIATFGKQSLNDDMMGLAIFFKTKQLKEITQDKLNHVVVLKPDNGYVEYYFMPTWELDWEPVVSKIDFQRCIDEVFYRLNNSIINK